jgi:hypothetical protein
MTNLKFMERKNNIECAAIIGEIDGENTKCCGLPAFKKNWCKDHHARYMVSPPKRPVSRDMSLIIQDQRFKRVPTKITETEIIASLSPCGRSSKIEENI